MIGNHNQLHDNVDKQSRIKLIANKRKLLEDRSAQIQTEIKNCFQQLAKVLQSRERQLLRQAEAIHRQQLSLVETSLNFLPSSIVTLNGRSKLEEQICCFGNIETHGSNGITVKDIEPYKVADYQDANKDHVSFDKSITCQKIKDHPNIPCYKNPIFNRKTLRISSLAPAFFIENQLRDLYNVKGNASLKIRDALSLSHCSPLLLIKRKLGLMHVSLDGLHAFDRIYPWSIRSFNMSCKTTEFYGLDTLTNEAMDTNLREVDKKILNQTDSESIRNIKEQEKNYEHPMQVQQWLQQILVETELEPAIQEIGQFSEISKAKFYNEL